MKKVIFIVIVTLAFINLVIFTNYAFALENFSDNNSNSKDSNQQNKQTIQCKNSFKCDNQSQQQQHQQKTKQNIDCAVNAKCTNYSTSNIVFCSEHSVCLLQYQGPFQLANPY
jgi:hypothetical protein